MKLLANALFPVLLFSLSAGLHVHGATRTAASCATSAVQAAIDASSDGDTVLIPNGSCTWTSGISTTKQIWIRAENYTPTTGGSSSRSVTITNNSSTTLFSLTTGNEFHVGLSGMAIREGTGSGGHLAVRGSGSKIALISDMYFEVKDRYWPTPWPVNWSAQGGVVWNSRFVAVGSSQGTWGGSFLVKGQPRVWNSASTMGALDASGSVNVYVEDCSCLNIGQFPDLDDHGRAVFRYNNLDGCSGVSHGFTSTWGGRHIEYYNNIFSVTTRTRNHTGRYYWIRAGTALFSDNVVNNASVPQEYGSVSLFQIGDNTTPGSYPMPRQPGWGHNGTTNVSDPIHSWNNTGARASSYGFQNGWGSIVQVGRDVFVDSGAKPGYSKYTYPHPARAAIGTTTPSPVDSTPPSAPTSLTAAATSSSQIALTWSPSSDDIGVTEYRIESCQGSSCSNFSQIGTATATSYTATGLPAGTAYRFRVRAADASGNLSSYSTIASATTQAAADTTPPSTPSNLSASASSSSQVSLAWTASTDNISVTQYRIESCQGASCSNFSQVGTSPSTPYIVSGLTASTAYRFRVRAADAAGNLSAYSNIASASTQAAADTTPPSTPSNLSASASSSSQISLSWTAATDNISVTQYRIESCQGASCSNFSQVGTSTGTSYNVSGLAAATAYRFRVRAADAAGNLSGYSSIVSATTQAATTTPPALPTGDTGLASLHPGDSNIHTHPDVLFSDDFESYSTASQLTTKWSQVYQSSYTRIATEANNVFAGSKSLEFRVPQQSAEVANEAIKTISPTEDTVFVRVYTRFEAGYSASGSSHNGIAVSAQYSTPGVPANGTNKFYVDVENSRQNTSEASPGLTNVYIYHPEQRSEWGDHWYPDGRVVPFDLTPGDFGPYFLSRPNFTPQLDRWYCYELMVKANTPGQRDGRIAVWIDGNLVADFLNVRLRDVSSLKIDRILIGLHIGSNTVRENKKWYDNLVVARSYIGPMSPSTTVAPPTNLQTSVR